MTLDTLEYDWGHINESVSKWKELCFLGKCDIWAEFGDENFISYVKVNEIENEWYSRQLGKQKAHDRFEKLLEAQYGWSESCKWPKGDVDGSVSRKKGNGQKWKSWLILILKALASSSWRHEINMLIFVFRKIFWQL